MDDELMDPLFERIESTYDGLVLMAQDLTSINVTPEQIVIRQTKADYLAWPPKPAELAGDTKPIGPAEGQRPDWLTNTSIKGEQ